MTETCVVIEVDLAVKREQSAFFGQDQGVDLKQRCVFLDISVITTQDHVSEVFGGGLGKPQIKKQLIDLIITHARCGMDLGL